MKGEMRQHHQREGGVEGKIKETAQMSRAWFLQKIIIPTGQLEKKLAKQTHMLLAHSSRFVLPLFLCLFTFHILHFLTPHN